MSNRPPCGTVKTKKNNAYTRQELIDLYRQTEEGKDKSIYRLKTMKMNDFCIALGMEEEIPLAKLYKKSPKVSSSPGDKWEDLPLNQLFKRALKSPGDKPKICAARKTKKYDVYKKQELIDMYKEKYPHLTKKSIKEIPIRTLCQEFPHIQNEFNLKKSPQMKMTLSPSPKKQKSPSQSSRLRMTLSPSPKKQKSPPKLKTPSPIKSQNLPPVEYSPYYKNDQKSVKPKSKKSPKKCKDDEELNPSSGRCRKKCKENQVRDVKTGKCKLPPPSFTYMNDQGLFGNYKSNINLDEWEEYVRNRIYKKPQSKSKCAEVLNREGITDKSSYFTWIKENHPDRKKRVYDQMLEIGEIKQEQYDTYIEKMNETAKNVIECFKEVFPK